MKPDTQNTQYILGDIIIVENNYQSHVTIL